MIERDEVPLPAQHEGVLSRRMGLHIQTVHAPRRIEYLRRAFEPARYDAGETELIAEPRVGGRLWHHLGINHVGMLELRKIAGGLHPRTEANLSARRHDRGGTQHRTAYASVLFTAPKSVSLMSELGGDYRLRHCLREAAETMLLVLENDYAGFRVRKRAAPDWNRPRKTAVAGWTTRLENDSRFGDPHLHVHAELFNCTVDVSDPRSPFKAFDLYPILRDQRPLRQRFDDDLARRVRGIGYRTVPAAEVGFEIEGIEPTLVERFSTGRRRALEHARAAEEAETPRPAAIAAAVTQLRPRKRPRTQAQLRQHWRFRLTAPEITRLETLRLQAERGISPDSAPAVLHADYTGEAADVLGSLRAFSLRQDTRARIELL